MKPIKSVQLFKRVLDKYLLEIKDNADSKQF